MIHPSAPGRRPKPSQLKKKHGMLGVTTGMIGLTPVFFFSPASWDDWLHHWDDWPDNSNPKNLIQ